MALTLSILRGVVRLLLLSLVTKAAIGLSPDVTRAIKDHYIQGDYDAAARILSKIEENEQSSVEDRVYSLIYLSLIEFIKKDRERGKLYQCRLLTVKPDVDPSFFRDVTPEFVQNFEETKKTNSCLPLAEYRGAVHQAMTAKDIARALQLLDRWEGLAPAGSESLRLEIGQLRTQINALAIAQQQGVTRGPNNPPAAAPASTASTCTGVIKFHVEELLDECAQLLAKKCYTSCSGGDATALRCCSQVRDLCPGHEQAQACFKTMEDFYAEAAATALDSQQFGKAGDLLESLKQVAPTSPHIGTLEARMR